MYIEYVRNQRVIDTFGDTKKKPNANPEHIYNSPVPEYKPTWLVRVSDMQVVPGSSVNGHYWALSYSWNQSGEITHKDGEDYERIDEGKHRITGYRTIPGYKMETASGFNEITDTDYDPETASTTFVAFEGLIQQVCKDFDIDYIWYDQMCINQSNHKEKMHEIKQMHRIYANALCTVALVPELQFTIKYGLLYRANEHILPRTQWCKRMWTLEEAYASKDILFLGHNVHTWSNATFIWMTSISKDYLVLFPGPTEEWIACTVLWYAKNRMSSKAHDRIFALANVLPELMGSISFTYDQPFHDLMFQFYRALARKDISILWFGAPLDSNPEVRPMAVRQGGACVSRPRKGIFKRFFRTLIKSGWTTEAIPTLQDKALPSWTGANGVHITQFALKHEPVTVNLRFFHTSAVYSMALFIP